jgi:site-specific DNA recombinase
MYEEVTVSKRTPEKRNGPSRVGIYTRISTDEAHQPYSLGAQEDRLESYVKSQDNWKIVRKYDDQMTGTVLERPGLQRALQDARAGKIDHLLVFRVDRLARSVRGLASILEELDEYGVAFRSATEPFDTGSPAGRMMVQMLGVFAEFERATLIERVIAGMERKAASGGWNGGNIPFGYDLDSETGFLKINEGEAPLVARVFELYVSERLGSPSVARWLNEGGHRTKKGTLWRAKSVLRLLTNRAYLGAIFFRDKSYPGKHPPIIDQTTFDRAQELLMERGEDCSKRRSNASEYLLSGSLVCARCRRRFTGTIATGKLGVRYRYYTCASRVQYGSARCDQARLRADVLEEAVLTHVLANLRDTRVVRRSMEKALQGFDSVQPKLQREFDGVRRKLKETQAAIDKYLRAFETGSMSPDVCGPRLAELYGLIHDLARGRDELEIQLSAKEALPDFGTVSAAAAHWAEELESADMALFKHLFGTLVPEILVESRSNIRPVIHLPRVRVVCHSVGRQGLEPCPPD